MNIFATDRDSWTAAENACDQHVVKMLLESAQILCTAATVLGIEGAPYKPTHQRHPCTLWVIGDEHARAWLVEHARALADQYRQRFNRKHKSAQVVEWCAERLPLGDATMAPDFACAMPDEIEADSTVEAYRVYYRRKARQWQEKGRAMRWTAPAVRPEWMEAA